MNNRYTFKAKRKDNGEWVYGYLIDDNDDYCIMVGGLDVNFDNLYTIDKDTICQCTGLQDIDGNYIFENDKIRGLRHHNKKQVIIEGFVEYNEFLARYDVSGNYYNGNQLSAYSNVEIIGNKFDKEVE